MFQSLKRDVAYFHHNEHMAVIWAIAFQSLKRDVAYFHKVPIRDVAEFVKWFQSLKRDVAYFHCNVPNRLSFPSPCFNRSSAMWPTSTC